MHCIAILADIRGSRREADRNALARALDDSLEQVNDAFDDALLAPFEVQRGVDEFGAVLRPTAPVGRILVGLWTGLHPRAVRIAGVRGEVDVVPEGPRPSVRLFDGPAFHRAKALLEEGRRNRRLVSLRLGGLPERDTAVTAAANLLYLHILRWTERQLSVLLAYRELGNQSAVAERFEITQPSVSDALSRIDGTYMIEAFSVFEELAVSPEGLDAPGETGPGGG